MRLLDGVLGLCFPPETRCALCGAPLPFPAPLREAICGTCSTSLPGIKLDFNSIGLGCADLRLQPFCRLRAAGPYKGDLKHAVWRFKYGGQQHLCNPLGALMARAAGDITRAGVVVPVPLHSARERHRGFNQALLLAKVVAELGGSVVEAGKLVRVRETLSQSSLKPEERRRNVEGAFHVAPRDAFAGKRVALVDDVFTTGSTIRECARTMLAFGAGSVDVVVCAMVEG